MGHTSFRPDPRDLERILAQLARRLPDYDISEIDGCVYVEHPRIPSERIRGEVEAVLRAVR